MVKQLVMKKTCYYLVDDDPTLLTKPTRVKGKLERVATLPPKKDDWERRRYLYLHKFKYELSPTQLKFLKLNRYFGVPYWRYYYGSAKIPSKWKNIRELVKKLDE